MATMETLIVFAHGKESGPWGQKSVILAAIAEEFGAQVLSPDYSDLSDPDARVALITGHATAFPRSLGIGGVQYGGLCFNAQDMITR